MPPWTKILPFTLAMLTLPRVTAARPPLFVIDPIPDQEVAALAPFDYQATVTVEDPPCWEDDARFHLLEAPAGMTVTGTGRINWTPVAEQVGPSFPVTLSATARRSPGHPCHGTEAQDSVDFAITVTPPLTVVSGEAWGDSYHFLVNGEPFFPLGGYNITHEEIPAAASRGANTDLHYANGVVDEYYPRVTGCLPCQGGQPPQCVCQWETGPEGRERYRVDAYLASLIGHPESYLERLAAHGIRAMISVQTDTYSDEEIEEIVLAVHDHPAVLGWYTADEPELREGTSPFHTPAALQATYDVIRAADDRNGDGRPDHPVFPVIAIPQWFLPLMYETNPDWMPVPPPYPITAYDALGADNYPFNVASSDAGYCWRTFGDLARHGVDWHVRQLHDAFNHGRLLYSLITVSQAQGYNPDVDFAREALDLTPEQVTYAALSPVIRGARALLAWQFDRSYHRGQTWCRTDDASDCDHTPDMWLQFFEQFVAGGLRDAVLRSGSPPIHSFEVFARDQWIPSSEYTWLDYATWVDPGKKVPCPEPGDPWAGFVMADALYRQVPGTGEHVLLLTNDSSHTLTMRLSLAGQAYRRPTARDVTDFFVPCRTAPCPTPAAHVVPVTPGFKMLTFELQSELEPFTVKVFRVTFSFEDVVQTPER